MYLLEREKLLNPQKRLRKLLEQFERQPIVYPLGPDADGVFYYWVITVKGDGDISEHITSIKDLKSGKTVVGCLCHAGTNQLHCYHIAAMLPVHATYEMVFRDIQSWSGRGLPTPVAHLRAIAG